MKLYTEKEVRAFFNDIYFFSSSVDDAMEQLTHIELPSDKDIENWAALTNPYMGKETKQYREGFIKCAKWMRDKIQGGNK